MGFDEFVWRATGEGYKPYTYQRRLAEDGLPDVLAVPTGAGKTLAATLPWLYRRRFHPDAAVRASTPHWLVLTLPMRVLVEQTWEEVRGWFDALGLSGEDVGLYRVMGGEGRLDARWRYAPEQDAVFVGTLDMLLSRALNRAYGESRWVWPLDFGLFNTGTQWVFDEVQLMGPGLPTSRQLDGLRRSLQTMAGCSSMWMSATVDEDMIRTIDNPELGRVDRLPSDDRDGPLRQRLEARKIVRELEQPDGRYLRGLAEEAVARHRPGTRTIVFLNTVDRATGVYDEILKRFPGTPVVLVHSRFRPGDRQRIVDAARAGVDPARPGLIVVATQVLEAGVDVSARTMLTELAPWPSIVQRAGRCNRGGGDDDAELWWLRPPKAAPYEQVDLDAASEALVGLEGRSAAPTVLEGIEVEAKPAHHPVLRRRDLLDLFDTSADLSGNDVDVARFIRDTDEMDVYVAWQELGGGPPREKAPLPGRDERCPVPLGALRDPKARLSQRRVWRFDHLAERWARCTRGDLRPGQVLLVDAADGGYDPERGWSPGSTSRVEPVPPASSAVRMPLTDDDMAVGADPVSYTRGGKWVSLRQHLGDVEAEARRLVDAFAFDGPASVLEAVGLAGRYHDLGKAHPAFQAMLASSAADDGERADADREPQPWAKSGGSKRGRHVRRHFRHELVSALMLLDPGNPALDGATERDLVVYLVAAHHGRVRLGFRSLPDEAPPPGEPDRLFALGVWDGEGLDPVELPDGVVPATTLGLSTMLLGRSVDGEPSWAERALRLRDRLGPFRLAALEALVRVADWTVSAGYDDEGAAARGR